MTKHCETCQNGEPIPDSWYINPSSERAARIGKGGWCTSKKIQEDLHYEEDSLQYSYSEGGRFWVGPKFGCVNHQEMEQ